MFLTKNPSSHKTLALLNLFEPGTDHCIQMFQFQELIDFLKFNTSLLIAQVVTLEKGGQWVNRVLKDTNPFY